MSLQTIAEHYVFATPYMEHVCDISGNTLPCDFAESVSRQCYETLQRRVLPQSPGVVYVADCRRLIEAAKRTSTAYTISPKALMDAAE